jgi:hypothetical protein
MYSYRKQLLSVIVLKKPSASSTRPHNNAHQNLKQIQGINPHRQLLINRWKVPAILVILPAKVNPCHKTEYGSPLQLKTGPALNLKIRPHTVFIEYLANQRYFNNGLFIKGLPDLNPPNSGD